MKTWKVALGAFVLAGLIIGCDTVDSGTNEWPQVSGNPDAAFIDAMTSHHAVAIDLSRLVVERGFREDVKALASRILLNQTTEVEDMQAIRVELPGQRTAPYKIDVGALRTLSGAELDAEYLDVMWNHHTDGTRLTVEAYPTLSRTNLRLMAADMLKVHSAEIQEIQALLGQ